MVKILVIEDDQDLNKFVCTSLSKNGYLPFSSFDGVSALELMDKENFDMIITDIMMPKLDGFTLAQYVREANEKIPILFMTALDDKISKQKGYGIGIDDYVVKPFDVDLLILRVQALLRRSNIEKTKELQVGNFRMNKDEYTALIDNEEINLSVREFNILFKLLSFPKKTFSRSQLMEEFWDYDSSATSRTVDVYMVKLREKTQKANSFEIQTVHGIGYKVVLK